MSDTIKSIVRMFTILECFLDSQDLSIKEIQEKTKLPKTTIFRILSTLEQLDYLVQNPDNHRYSLGFKFFHLGSVVQNSFDVRKVAFPIMQQLAKETLETIDLNIVSGCERVCIEKVDSPETIRNFVQVGQRNPLHLGGSGKLLLAFLPEEKQNEYFHKFNITDKEKYKLYKDLEEIRKNGYSVTEEERIKGSFAISAPIYDYSNQVIAGITIAGPIQRLTESHKENLIICLLEASKKISTQLGYNSDIIDN